MGRRKRGSSAWSLRYAWSLGVERILDDPSAFGVVRDACRHEDPAQPRIDAAARLTAGWFLFRRVEVELSQDQLARANGQDDGHRGAERMSRAERDEAPDARPRDEHERDAGGDRRETGQPLRRHVRVPRHKECRQEMRVEPLLIGDRGPRDHCNPKRCDRDFGNDARGDARRPPS